ncbi:MAG: PepSY-like domain-containing protein [Mucilaginibacter sp.]
MKARTYLQVVAAAVLMMLYASCKKDALQGTATQKTVTKPSSSNSIAVAVNTTDSTGKDTVYLVNCFSQHSKRDSVAFSTLPSAIGAYLTANYSGYTPKMAFKVVDSVGTTTDYIVVIQYNGEPVGLKFTAAGVFEKVLEQQDGHQMRGEPWRPGAPFGDRDGPMRDTISLSAIPSVVINTFKQSYPSDTLMHASITPDSTYMLISGNNGMYVTDIDKAGKVLSRKEILPPGGPAPRLLTQDKLSATIVTYLTTTYPGYVFNGAFVLGWSGSIKGYEVFITENSTNYDVQFDSSGKFVRAITLR